MDMVPILKVRSSKKAQAITEYVIVSALMFFVLISLMSFLSSTFREGLTDFAAVFERELQSGTCAENQADYNRCFLTYGAWERDN